MSTEKTPGGYEVLPGEAPYKNRLNAAKDREKQPWSPSKEDWDSLILLSPSPSEVQLAVKDDAWQKFRVHLLGMSHGYRHHALYRYLHELDDVTIPLLHTNEEWQLRIKQRRVRVANYVHALRRGGLIP